MTRFNLLAMIFVGSAFVMFYHLVKGAPLDQLLFLYIKEVGMALLIGVFLYLALDRALEKERERQTDNFIIKLTKSFFSTIYKNHVPSVVWSEVEETILTSKSYLRDIDIDYVLSPLPGSTHFKVDIIIKYDLVNGADHPIAVPVTYGLDTHLINEHLDLVQIKQLKVWSKNKLEKPVGFTKGKTTKVEETIHVSPNTHAHIEIRATTVKRVVDSEFIALTMPTENLTLSIQSPYKTNVRALANNSKELRLHKSNGASKVYKLKSGLFPHQSILFSWRKE